MNYRVSFSTVCMNRLHHLKATLKRNILDNKVYENLEFILLDYNSIDGLEVFVKDNFAEEIEKKRLVYYKTTTPINFNRSHSRNLAFKLASGDIICNLDADNFTGNGFAKYINKAFKQNYNIFMSADFPYDAVGRICFSKEALDKTGGYDERMTNYGSEDVDFKNRLERLKLTNVKISSSGFLKVITHPNEERIANESIFKDLESLWFSYSTPFSTTILFLLKDGSFIKGSVLRQNFKDAERLYKIEQPGLTVYIKDQFWERGDWKISSNILLLTKSRNDKQETLYFSYSDRRLENRYYIFYRIDNSNLVTQAIILYSRIHNRLILERNKRSGQVKVNLFSLKSETVFKNFNFKDPIAIA